MHLPPAGVEVETFEPVIALNWFNARISPIPLMMPFLIKRITFISKDVLRFYRELRVNTSIVWF